MLATSPLISVVLFTKIVVLYSGLVADTAALVCFSVIGTVVPHAACRVAFTFAAAVSDRKSNWMVLDSSPLTNLWFVSDIAVTSSSSKVLLIVALVTWSVSTTLFKVTTTVLFKYTAISYSSVFSVAVVFVFVSFGGSVICPILIKKAISSSVYDMVNSSSLVWIW
jgi:hypothetical protein